MSRIRTLGDQAFCGWCGSELINKSALSATCSSCEYVNYVNPKPVTSTIITFKDSVLLLKRAIEPEKGKYDLPGGFMDATDDSIEETTYREIKEELNLENKDISDLKYFGSSTTLYVYQDTEMKNVAFYFICKIEDSNINLDESENTDYVWIKEVDLPSIVLAWPSDRKMLNNYFKENK